MNRKGFTLIELMVVIVIIGILAATAIPKLFGMTAKAKFMDGNYSKAQSALCLDYFNANQSAPNFYDRIHNGYRCKNYLRNREDESVVTETSPAPIQEQQHEGSIYELFISGNITDDERNQCITHMSNVMSDNDLSNAFQARVRNGLTCESMMNVKKNKNKIIGSPRYKIMNDETVIFYSNDAAQLAADMAEVKDKMTRKNIKSSIQTSTGTVVTYGF